MTSRTTKVKICGITNPEDASRAIYYGAWALGFVFYKKSPRYISPSRARKLIEQLPPFVTPVGVFVNQSERALKDVCRFTRIQTIQLHGDEDPAYCKRLQDYKIIKAFRVASDFHPRQVTKYKVDSYLFDAHQEELFGGTGKRFNWDLIKNEKWDKPVILAGGLCAENIVEAIETIEPYAVDVSSQLEQEPGVKSPAAVRALFETMETIGK